MMIRASAWAFALALVSAPIARADQIQYIPDATTALAAFHGLARGAEKSLDLATFIFEPCHPSTLVLLETLEQKARQGVKLRVLLDAFMQPGPQKRNLANYFAKSGIRLKYYNNYTIPHIGINLRLHAKIFVADRARYVMGGRNISDDYFSLGLDNFIDRDVFVRGASAAAASEYFDELWNSSMVSSPSADPAAFIPWRKFCPVYDSARVSAVRSLVERSLPSLAETPVRECADVKFAGDNPEFGRPEFGADSGDERPSFPDSYMTAMRLRYKRATRKLLQFIEGTKRNLEVENWSYMPTGLLQTAFDSIRDKSRRIRVITNRDMEGPDFFRQAMEYAIEWASGRDEKLRQKTRFVSRYGRLRDDHELSPRDGLYRLHGKVLVRDATDVAVSSFNMDPRSYNVNVESVLLARGCPAFAADVQAQIDRVWRIREADLGDPSLPPKEEASFGAKLFALFGLAFF